MLTVLLTSLDSEEQKKEPICPIRCVCKKSFLSFPYFPWLLKNMQNQNKFVGNSQSFPPPPTSSTEFPPLHMRCNIHHFGITKREVMASKLQVTPTKLQITNLTADTKFDS